MVSRRGWEQNGSASLTARQAPCENVRESGEVGNLERVSAEWLNEIEEWRRLHKVSVLALAKATKINRNRLANILEGLMPQEADALARVVKKMGGPL